MSEIEKSESPMEIEAQRKDGFRFPVGLAMMGLVLGLSVEVLFYGHALGISFFLWVSLCAIMLLGAAAMEGLQISRQSQLLLIPILFLSFMVFLRLEPLTVFLNILLTLALLALWVRTFRDQRLFEYGWLDLGLTIIWVPLEAWIRPWAVLSETQGRVLKGGGRKELALAVLRGIVLSIPVLAIMILLLSGADLVFQKRLEEALQWLDLERLADLASRTVVVVVSGLFLLGTVALGLRDWGKRKLIGQDKPLVRPFLGFVESLVVLGAVDLLFAFFVGIQFAYLFGGASNINALGYTYSEYARKGFGELVVVGILSLLLIFGLACWSRREKRSQKACFHGLSSLLVAEVLVILVSAMTRLLLYERAYGFTRLRTYTNILIIWMAVLLLAFLILLFQDRLRRFALASLLGMIGFTVTLNLVNVDAFIVKQNFAHLEKTSELDVAYLARLTEDAIPPMVKLALDGSFGDDDQLLGELACWEAQLEARLGRMRWPSTHLGRLRASRMLAKVHEMFEHLQVLAADDYGPWRVWLGGEERYCQRQLRWFPGVD